MNTPSKNIGFITNEYALETPGSNGIGHIANFFAREDILHAFEKIIEFKNMFQQNRNIKSEDQSTSHGAPVGKKHFLVFKHNKYITVPTEKIAFFYIKYESPIIVCFDKQEYFVNYSLEQIQSLLGEKEFFRINRQYLVNFSAVKEVEHYFARKLLVNLVVPTNDKLLVSKEKVSSFLHWLDNR